MIRFFMRVVLGGQSNKREGPLFAFLVAVAWGSWVIWHSSQGVDMSAVTGFVGTFAVASLGAFAGTASLHHMKPPGDPENLPENGPSAFPGYDHPQEQPMPHERPLE